MSNSWQNGESFEGRLTAASRAWPGGNKASINRLSLHAFLQRNACRDLWLSELAEVHGLCGQYLSVSVACLARRCARRWALFVASGAYL
jgi:hypothetical protein